jgi:hypothetical protein
VGEGIKNPSPSPLRAVAGPAYEGGKTWPGMGVWTGRATRSTSNDMRQKPALRELEIGGVVQPRSVHPEFLIFPQAEIERIAR